MDNNEKKSMMQRPLKKTKKPETKPKFIRVTIQFYIPNNPINEVIWIDPKYLPREGEIIYSEDKKQCKVDRVIWIDQYHINIIAISIAQ